MKRYTLSNGIRVLTQTKAGARAAAVAAFVGVGSRFETGDEQGFSHFIEHMVFKGTHRRSSADIANETDMIGGQLNAYTTKEYTCFYIRTLTEFTAAGIDILGDIVTDPLFDAGELDTERGVILEEISMYDDDAEDLAGDRIYRACWGDNPLGASITGTVETVSAATAQSLREFYLRYYRPENIVLSVSGKFDEGEVRACLEKAFGGMKAEGFIRPEAQAPIFTPDTLKIKKDSQQLQFCLAYPAEGAGSKRGSEYTLLNTIAGGGASGLLFRRLREELGLAYSIYSYFTAHKGAGVLVIAGGISPQSRSVALREIDAVLGVMMKEITPEQLQRAKNQVRSGIAMSGENSYNAAMEMGRRELLGLPQRTERATLTRIEAVEQAAVVKAANDIFGAKPAGCFVGKLK